MQLDITRFGLLLKMELFRSRKALLMTLVIIFGSLFLIDLLLATFLGESPEVYEHSRNFTTTLHIGGFILSSLAFHDLSSSLKRVRYLNLPASTLEKFVSMWLLSSVGWIVVFTLCYTLYTLLVNPLGQRIFPQMTFVPFAPMSEFALDSIKCYFILQGIFLVGAAHFKGYVFPKTLFTLILFISLCIGIIYLMMAEIFLSDHVCSGEECEIVDVIQVHPVWQGLSWLFWWALAPLCWIITYLGLKEQEV